MSDISCINFYYTSPLARIKLITYVVIGTDSNR
jgi:hypothetical protein